MNFTTTAFQFGGRRVLVAYPNEHQYGHLCLEVVMSLVRARDADADVCFVRPSTRLGGGLFELESSEVRVLHPTPVVRGLLRAWVSWRKLLDRVDRWRYRVREQVGREFVREATRYVANPSMPQQVRERLRSVRRRLAASLERATEDRHLLPPYYERHLLREPVPVQLHPAASKEAAAQARAHGIPPDAPLVCIHAREAGYKLGREVHDRKPHEERNDQTRNARIETYFEVADYLVELGYTVIRIGDPSMRPVHRPGVVDLATSPARTNLLEVYCLLRSNLIIAGESAYVNMVSLTNTPILLVNVTEPISAYPIRAPGLFLPKTVVDKRDGRRLTSLDLLSLDYHRQFRDTRRFLYMDNSPQEIREATREILEWLAGDWTESADQRTYHEAIMAAAARLRRRSQYVRKWGLHEGFLGDGRVARVALSTQ